MGFADSYIESNLIKNITIEQVQMVKSSDLLNFFIIIPAYCEEEIYSTLESILACTKPTSYVAVVILINYSESVSEEIKNLNNQLFTSLATWCEANTRPELSFYCLLAKNLPKKHAGAGLARKLAMDWAVCRLNEMNNQKGILISLDADTLVATDYLLCIEREFYLDFAVSGCTIYFEHPVSGNAFSSEVYRAAIQYELYLRCFKHALAITGFPHAIYTIGSCFGVRADIYVKYGGMNRKQAGEDFYFLHKIVPYVKFKNISGTCVYPSPRPSWRVPFGTGPAISKLMASDSTGQEMYNFQSFTDLKHFINRIPDLYSYNEGEPDALWNNMPESICAFLVQNDLLQKLREIKSNTSSKSAFVKRFFHWFNAFAILKYLNFSRDKYHPNVSILEAVKDCLSSMNLKHGADSEIELLNIFRTIDKRGN